MKEIEQSWSIFLEKPFPEDCVGLEIEGIELVSLDTFSAGCIETFIANVMHPVNQAARLRLARRFSKYSFSNAFGVL
jgi:hypothetical protein